MTSFLNTEQDISNLGEKFNDENENTHSLNSNDNGDANLYDSQQLNLYNFYSTSVSDAIDASVTLEDFEEQERQIVQELSDPTKTKNDLSPVLMSESPQNRQSLNMRRNSISIDSDEYDLSKSYSTVAVSNLPPYEHTEDSNFQMEQNIEFPVPPPHNTHINYLNDKSNELQSHDIKSGISSSFALAGEMAAMVGSNTLLKPKANTFLSTEIYDGSNSTSYSTNSISPDIDIDNNNQKKNLESNNLSYNATQLNSEERFKLTLSLNELFSQINKYEPKTIEIETMLRPFLLDYIPAVGDVDPFIKVTMLNQKDENNLLGLNVLDEPSLTQSDSTIINFKLHQSSKNVLTSETPIKSLMQADKNKDKINAWIETTREFRKTKPCDKVTYVGGLMPDVDSLMQEWSPEMETIFNNAVFPSSKLDTTLEEYTDLCLAIADIPVYNNRRIQSLYAFFLLYSEFKNSQHFRNFEANNNVYDSSISNENINHDNLPKSKVNNRLEL